MRRHRLHRLLLVEIREINRQVKDVFIDGLVRPSRREFYSVILFVRHAGGSLRMCIECRGLNEVTRKDAYPLPRAHDTLDELKDANFYIHLDLASRVWQIRVREEDAHKISFPTFDGLMKWVAMRFGLCNAPATLQRMMNEILRYFLLVRVRNILIDHFCIYYNRTLEEHMAHICITLQRLKEELRSEGASKKMCLWATRHEVPWLHCFRSKALRIEKRTRGGDGVVST
jgi:hypothetical protein